MSGIFWRSKTFNGSAAMPETDHAMTPLIDRKIEYPTTMAETIANKPVRIKSAIFEKEIDGSNLVK